MWLFKIESNKNIVNLAFIKEEGIGRLVGKGFNQYRPLCTYMSTFAYMGKPF